MIGSTIKDQGVSVGKALCRGEKVKSLCARIIRKEAGANARQ